MTKFTSTYTDHDYAAEAKLFNENFLCKFQLFVDLYNKLNNVTLSVNDALWVESIVDQFTAVSITLQAQTATPIKRNTKSTKLLSYEQFNAENGTSTAHTIFNQLRGKQPQTRSELAVALDMRLSTVCGQVTPLLVAGLVRVVGTKLDSSSNRLVETLVAVQK